MQLTELKNIILKCIFLPFQEREQIVATLPILSMDRINKLMEALEVLLPLREEISKIKNGIIIGDCFSEIQE